MGSSPRARRGPARRPERARHGARLQTLWARRLRGAQKGVDIVFVNTDGEEDRARAQARLEKAGLGKATHYGFADDFVDKLFFEADRSWRGELPFTALVAADGKETTVTGAIDDPLVVNWLAGAGK